MIVKPDGTKVKDITQIISQGDNPTLLKLKNGNVLCVGTRSYRSYGDCFLQ